MNRHAVIIPVAILASCNAAAVALEINVEGAETFTVPLVSIAAAPGDPVTHYGACGVLKEEVRQILEAGFEANQYPGSRWFRWNMVTGKVGASWNASHIGEAWSWEQSLEALGLKIKPQEMEP